MVYKICIEINSFKNNVLKLLNCWPKLFLKISFAILSTLLFLSGCSKQQGSDRMRKELANIYAQGLENPAKKNENAWITIELEGRTANRQAIGARIEIIILLIDGQNRKIVRTIGTGGSFGSGSLQAEIGLGKAKQIQKITIIWPNARQTTETYNNLAINKFYHIVEGKPPAVLDRVPVPFRKVSKMKHNY